jgi:hypothetical protein
VLTNSAYAYAYQWRDELQVNADHDFVTATAGLLHYRDSTYPGSPKGTGDQHVLSVFPNGRISPSALARNKTAVSLIGLDGLRPLP